VRELSLFTGAGGMALGTKLLGWEHYGYVEINEYCQRIIAQRIKDGILREAPIFTDVRKFIQSGAAHQYRGFVDVVTGGDPCQANSNAQRSGTTPESLGDEFIEIVDIVRPRLVVRENPSHVKQNAPWPADRFAHELEGIGYTSAVIEGRACCLGADHQRKRLLVFAWLSYANPKRLPRLPVRRRTYQAEEPETNEAESLSVSDGQGTSGAQRRVQRRNDDVAYRVDRLKAIGNGFVPPLVVQAWETLT
jgi:DNA (cytosine-5)-methyltransferase 1